jgi:hypothetical protein
MRVQIYGKDERKQVQWMRVAPRRVGLNILGRKKRKNKCEKYLIREILDFTWFQEKY